MIICPRCNGKGSVSYPIDYEQGLFDETNCPLCGGSGKVLTNEEWRKTCSTEEYAAWLWKHFDDGEVIVLWQKYGCPMHKDNNGVSRADYTEAMKKWLKEIHK